MIAFPIFGYQLRFKALQPGGTVAVAFLAPIIGDAKRRRLQNRPQARPGMRAPIPVAMPT
jgi:hypothetical protein